MSRECRPFVFEDLGPSLQESLLICCSVMAGLVPAIHVIRHAEKDVDARAFAAPKRLRPRRRDKPGHDDVERAERNTPIVRPFRRQRERGRPFLLSMLNMRG
ncbi:hypothetical protein BRAO285_1530007 [Bradyrhizobium sp. ORS 285]|nr:hypothetical protein BRAO285_1530007 [Bradyrhizobium sp. ORS 285]